MKAKVKAAVFSKELTLEHGTFYQYNILLDNGMQGQYLSKNNPQTFFIPGNEAEFEITKTEKNGREYQNFKPVRAGMAGGFKPVNPLHENKRVALKCAVQLVSNGIINKSEIKTYSDNFLKYLTE